MTSLDPSNEASMIPRIGDLVARVMKNPGLAKRVIASTDLVNEIGLDSLQMIDFLLGVEDEFGVEVDFDALKMEDLTSVAALCRFVDTLRSTTSSTDVPPTPRLHKTASEGA